MITWRGISYLLLTAACYLILAYTGFRLLAVLMPILLFLPLLSAIQLGLAVRWLKFSQRLEPGVTEREGQVRLIATMQQTGWLSHGELELIVVTPGRSGRVLHERRNLPLLAGTSRDVVFTVDCPHRGFYNTGLVTLRTRDLLGLFYLPVQSRRKTRKMAARLAILPHSQQTAPFTDLISSLSDWQHQQTPEYGEEVDAVANIRTHRPGDSMKRTHWKLSARLDKIMIKEFEKPVQRAGLLLLDMARSARDSRRRSPCLDFGDYFTDRAAYLIRLILDTGNRLRLVAYQDQGRQELTVEHPADLQQAQLLLAGLGWTDRWPAGPALAEETGSDKAVCFVVLMTTRINDEMAGNLLVLQSRNLPVWLVLLRGSAPHDTDQEIALRKLQNTGLAITLLDIRQQAALAEDT